MEWNSWYIEWVEDMWNKCPNCESIDFDIIKRKCLDCGYELNHNTLKIIVPIKKVIDEKLNNENNQFFEDPYDSKQKWFDDDKKYFK